MYITNVNNLSDIDFNCDSLKFYTMLESMEFKFQSGDDKHVDIDMGQELEDGDGIVHFSNVESEVAVSKPSPLRSEAFSYLTSRDDYIELTKIMERPEVISSGVFSATDTGTTFTFFNWADAFQGASTMKTDKMKGIFSIRADLKVTIHFNANRFQAGRYILGFFPTGGDTQYCTAFYAMHKFSITTVTQLPHVQFDLNCESSATLYIPWSSAFEAVYNTSAVENDVGRIFIYPYRSVVTTAGTSTVPYSVYVSYHNVHFGGLTVPQSGLIVPKRKKKDVLTEEVKNTGVISGGLAVGARISTALSTVPLLSSIATPTSWVLDALSRAAASFGWSKPIVMDAPHRVVRASYPYSALGDQHSTAEPLSLCGNNHVEIDAGFPGTDLDEMSIDYLKSVYACFGGFSWPAASAVGTLLYGQYIKPTMCTITQNDGAVPLLLSNPVGYMANKFSYYTGSLNFKIIFVKTEFHTGRLSIALQPLASTSTNTAVASLANHMYLHREIIDIAMGNEFIFNLPYVAMQPWTLCDVPYAYLDIRILEPLAHPATVASTIDIKYEIAGGDDLSFAVPNNILMQPVQPSSFQSNVITCIREKKTLGSNVLREKNLEAESYCIGEAILSLRTLLKRGDPVTSPKTLATSGNADVLDVFKGSYATSNGTVLTDSEIFDVYNFLGHMYTYSKGGVRIKPYTFGVNTTQTWYASIITPGLTGAATNHSTAFHTTAAVSTGQYTRLYSGGTGTIQMLSNVGYNEFQIPMYHRMRCRVNSTDMVTSSLPGTANSPTCPTRAYLYQSGSTFISTAVFQRAGADDCNFGGFLGIPPYTIITT